MLVHNSVQDPDPRAFGKLASVPARENSTASTSSSTRSSRLKFFSSSSAETPQVNSQRQEQPIRRAQPATLAKTIPSSQAEPRVQPIQQLEPSPPQDSVHSREKLQKRWTVDYLSDLRKPSGARPMGARPAPGRTSTESAKLPPRASFALVSPNNTEPGNKIDQLKRSISPFGARRSHSALDHHEHAGRPLAREPNISLMADIAKTNADMDNVKVEINGEKAPMPYYERGQRWMERQEAKSLRAAMDLMDLDKEKRVYEAAQEEAADLVWKHKYPGKAYRNPDDLNKNIKEHLRKGSHARSQSIGPFETLYVTKGGYKDGKRLVSDSSTSNKSDTTQKSSGSRVSSTSSKASNDSSQSTSGWRRYGSSTSKLFGSLRGSRKSRAASGETQQSIFGGPNDQVFEEPGTAAEVLEEVRNEIPASSGALKPKSRNISGGQKSGYAKNDFLAKTSFIDENKISSIDIHKNPPSQSRDPQYTRNRGSIRSLECQSQIAEDVEKKPTLKDGLEIRSDDIRAATSMKLKERSETLPKPTYVSDSPGRPIVSFESSYNPKDPKQTGSRPGSKDSAMKGARPMPSKPSMPLATASAPIIPTIHVPFSKSSTGASTAASSIPAIVLPEQQRQPEKKPALPLPSINLPNDPPSNHVDQQSDVPIINLPDEDPCTQTSVPNIEIAGLDQPKTSPRPLPHHSRTAPPANPPLRGHWSPAVPRISATACCACGLAIQGRTLSAAGQRFHPECFNCFQCVTNLEHVAFYPEPESARDERIADEEAQGFVHHHDRRFFCHLDFHELFSPRCKSCKTPIEGEVILACGAQWHQGHFFCAQCGDPFDGSTPYIEKDGWAWCVGCYKGRYSGKCRGCKKPVTENGVKALGAEWHDGCFRCNECNGPFENGQFFTRGAGEGPVCVKCEERRLKA